MNTADEAMRFMVWYAAEKGAQREREAIIALLREHVSASPGGAAWVDRVVREIERRGVSGVTA